MRVREVPIRTKLLYGVADIATAVKNSSLNQFLLFFYADVVLIAPTAVGLAIFAGRLWDAITDPLMGHVSDTTRSTWGRRRPYILLGAVPMGIFYYFLFSPPEMSPGWTTLYLALTTIVLFSAFTVFAVPYLAWGAELARDYHERTEVVQVRTLFGVVGGMIGAITPIWIANQFEDTRLGFSTMAMVLGSVITIAALVTGFSVREKPLASVPRTGLREFYGGLRETLGNRSFLIVFATFFLMTVSSAIGQAVQLVVIKYRLGLFDAYPLIALTFALCFAGSFPVWLAISRRIGKRRALLSALTYGCIGPLGWVLIPPGSLPAMLLFTVVAGSMVGSITLAISQAADIVDIDELRTGEKRAGSYFGIWALGLKTAGAVGILIGGGLLDLIGYVPDAPQAPSTSFWLVMIVGPLQSVTNLIGLLIFRNIEIEEADIRNVQAQLDARS